MTYLDHLSILRRQLWFSVAAFLIAFGVSIFLYDLLVDILTAPLAAAAENTGKRLYLTTVYEGFLARIRIALIAGFVLSLPVHIVNSLSFIFPALTSREKRIAAIVVCAGFVLSLLSLYYAYSFLVPFSIRFLTGDSFMAEGTAYLLGFTKNILYILQFFTAVVVIFQLPLLMLLLISLQVLSTKSAAKGGRYVIVGSFVLSAILTPPDMVSQVMTALPLIVLYYLGLLAAQIFRLGAR